MKIAVLLALTAAAVAVTASAQDPGAKTRLDEFALPRAKADASVAQIAREGEVLLPEQPRDRAIASPPSPPAADAPLRQIAHPGEAPAATHLGPAQAPSAAGAPALSARAESKPGPVARLAGDDQCDPQRRTTPAELARCRRILELRAAEFSATAAPVLSAEQVLLAEQLQPDDMRIDRVGGMPRGKGTENADERSNQELAAALRQPVPAPPPREPEDTGATDASLAQVLQGLIVQMGGSSGP
jgi:hypothetical protein